MARTTPSTPREIGRIRLGDQQATKSGKKAPHKLDRFRLTSDSETVLHSAAKAYGGEVVPWPQDERHPKDEWQLYTTADALKVTIPVHYALSISYERWSAGGCTQRCDGQVITHSPLHPGKIGQACECEDQQEDACPRLLRMNVLLREVSGLGVWRMDSKGFYATAELVNDMEKFQAFGLRGMMVPALLRLKFREIRKLALDDKGQRKYETRQFYVPCLEFEIAPDEFLLATTMNRPELLLPSAQRTTHALPVVQNGQTFNERVADLFGDEVNPTAHKPQARAAEAEVADDEQAINAEPTDEPPITYEGDALRQQIIQTGKAMAPCTALGAAEWTQLLREMLKRLDEGSLEADEVETLNDELRAAQEFLMEQIEA